jgi:hypothetical protein
MILMLASAFFSLQALLRTYYPYTTTQKLCCTAVLLLRLQDDVRAFRFDGLALIDALQPADHRTPLYFESKQGKFSPGYITPGEGTMGAWLVDFLRMGKGEQPRNFQYLKDKLKVGCCVWTLWCACWI